MALGRIAGAARGSTVEPREEPARAAPPPTVAVPAEAREPLHLVWMTIIRMELRVSPRSFCPQRRHFPVAGPGPTNSTIYLTFWNFPVHTCGVWSDKMPLFEARANLCNTLQSS